MTDLVDKFVNRYGRLPTEIDRDYLEMLRMSKYRIKDVPDLPPGKCANCGSSKGDGRKYVDFGLDVPWYGIVWLCSLCLKDIGHNAGIFVELEEELVHVNKLLLDRMVLEKQGKELKGELTEVFEGVKYYLDELRSLGSDSDPSSSASVESYKESSKQAIGEGESVADGAKQRATKPTPSTRPKDLLSLTERLQAGS